MDQKNNLSQLFINTFVLSDHKLITMNKNVTQTVLITAIILILPVMLVAQQMKTTFKKQPAGIVSRDGSYMLNEEGVAQNNDTGKFVATSSKSKKRIMIKETVQSGVVNFTVAEIAYKGKTIKYGPWRMLNEMKTPSFNIDKEFRYESGGRMESGGGSAGARRVVVKVIPRLTSILKLNPEAQLSVIQGRAFSVQVGRFKLDKTVNVAMQRISGSTSLPVIVVIKDGIYYVVIEGFSDWKESKLYCDRLALLGFKGIIVRANSVMKVAG
jgi:hypothetical protein